MSCSCDFQSTLRLSRISVLIWLHLVAATVWIGGILFLALVFVPVLRNQSNQTFAQTFFRAVAQRFRIVARVAIILLIVTGILLLDQRALFSLPFDRWPSILLVKLLLVSVLIAISLFHELIIGPKVKFIKEIPESVRTQSQHILLRMSPWINRTIALLSVSILYTAAILART